ncbi:uncharacterized protein LOC129753271 [Uranotaenia lowii]|uniref:uncharacterized protein LOC129753271 n=1 Tax=Uranotaenia lowii TaxID=190385 RepID=UPI0024797CF3|nr:uncharacterized protein LOC129753271 [Uranotaenia lowii]
MSKTRSKTSVLRGLLATFSGIYSFMERYNEDRDSGELAVRLEKLDPLWEKVEEAFTEVEDADGEAGGEENRYVKDRLDFQNKFFELKAFLTSRIRMCSEISAALPTHESTIITSSHPHVKLPLISLPKFSGNVEDWLAFRDLFLSLIHHSPDLPMIEKFHYLRSQLEGEALSVISSLALTQSNYMIAWDLLVARYSNNKVLKKRQVQNIFDLPVLRKESATDLYKLVEGFDKATKVLDQVIQASDYKDLLLIHVLSSRLDDKTRRSWEEHSSTMEEETLKDFVEFLRRRIHILDSLPTKTIEPTQSLNRKSNHIKVASHGAVQLPSESWKCICCSESHPLHTCPVFGRLPVEEREKRLRLQSLCRNCFRRGHRAQECTSKFSCRRCKGRHHTLVCFKTEEGRNSQRVKSGGPRIGQAVNDGASTSGGNEAQKVASNVVRTAQKILLATAIVWVQDDSGRRVPARALLDSGSECNIISTSLSQRLRIQRGRVQVQISGVGQVPTNTKERMRASIQSLQSDYSQTMEFYVLPKVTEDLPTSNISISTWRLPEEIKLADPDFFKSNPIDLLLGGEYFFCFFPTKQRIQLGEGLPMLVHSVFGWLVTGRCGVSSGEAPILCQHSSISQSLEKLMSKFWEIEEGRSSSKYSVEETRCEENFIQTVKRADDGRYIVGLPKSPEAVARLGESKSAALRRWLQLERRLDQNESLRSEYNDFMSEYLSHGHMRKVMEPNDNILHFYLPHHPVIKASSTTTRVRVVFDASAKSTNGISLNDALLNGPVIQDDLRTLIIRSRFFPIILIADVEKMFRQVWIDAADLPLQRILWRFSPTDPIDTFELLTVTYGTKPAPFLATRCLKQLSLDEASKYPLAAKRLEKDVYMDDVITGAMDVDEAKVLRKQLDDLTQSGGFRLRKWVSNIPAALEGISEDNLAIPFGDGIDFEAEKTVKTLGLNSHWNHVPGLLNPADQLSRGLDPELVIHDEAWWNGPPWLAQEKEFWPRQSDSHPEAENTDLERKRISNPNVISPNSKNEFSDWYFSQFTDYTKLIRATAYFRRFLKYLRAIEKKKINSIPLCVQELHDAEYRLVCMVQKDYFPKEYAALQKGNPVHRSSKLRWYVPRLDEDGIIRIGGRLQNSEQPEDAKHPMVIPGKHPFAELLADCYHRRLLHAGCQLLLSTIRLKFWPLGGRNLCRKVIHKCLICFRAKPNLQQQFMSQLPKTRITISKPFTNTCVDYFGPVYIRQGFRKGPIKAYVAVFVCFATKAVHLELVSDLSSPRFIQALRRFIARRGKCCNIYSDNGANFVGARNVMRDLIKKLKSRIHHDEIQNECSQNGINWHFIPPGSPHFGGLWEAAVRSAKKHLLRVLGTSSASQEDYITLLAQVEACLNSRPLTQLTDDPTDLEPLTPGHFLIGSSMQALPDEELSSVPENRLNQLQLKQQQLDRFWRRWSTEYLTQLQARVKNWQPPIDIQPGRLVIMIDENQPSMNWKMARIHQLHPGDDGVTRVVTLKTAKGYTKRAINKICLLPITTDPADEQKVSEM